MPIGELLHDAHGSINGTELLTTNIALDHLQFLLSNRLVLKALQLFKAGIDGALRLVGIDIAADGEHRLVADEGKAVVMTALIFILERCSNHKSHSVLVRRWQFVVVQSANIFYMYYLEYIVDTQRQLHIRTIGVNHITALGEVHHHIAVGVIRCIRVVSVGQLSPKHAETYPLSPLQLSYQRNSVQYFSVHIPVHLRRNKSVGGELHVVDSLERVVLNDIREVGLRHDE